MRPATWLPVTCSAAMTCGMKVLTAKYGTTRQKKRIAATRVAVRYSLVKSARRLDFPVTAPDSHRGDSGTLSRRGTEINAGSALLAKVQRHASPAYIPTT